MDTSNLKPFIAFLDMVANPDKYKTLILDLKKATEDYYAAVGLLKSVDEVKEWQKKLQMSFQEREKILVSEQERLQSQNKEFKKTQDEYEERGLKRSQNVAMRELEVGKREAAVKLLEAQQQRLNEQIKGYEQSRNKLEEERRVLKQKEESLKAALR